MNRLSKPALMHALLGVAAAWGLSFGVTTPTHAQAWSEYAMVSATMGVSDGRIWGSVVISTLIHAKGILQVTGNT